MAKKWGEDFANEMVGRGFRELGGFLYPDSNILQPMYPYRGGAVAPKEVEQVKESILDQYPEQSGPSQDGPAHDDRGIDRD